MPLRRIRSRDELRDLVGVDLGASEWHTVTQDQIKLFADATGDHQWIHVDTERAAEGPFGTTIAHGYLSLALIPTLMGDALSIDSARMGINYGLNRVRFPAPLLAGNRVRAKARLKSVDEFADGVQIILEVAIECEGSIKPVCVAETISRLYF